MVGARPVGPPLMRLVEVGLLLISLRVLGIDCSGTSAVHRGAGLRSTGWGGERVLPGRVRSLRRPPSRQEGVADRDRVV